jgi:hypothetical protein
MSADFKTLAELVEENKTLRSENERLYADSDLQRTRLASILFSGVLDEKTGGEVREWERKFRCSLAKDKERLDWMEAHECCAVKLIGETEDLPGVWEINDETHAAKLRDAIDAAMNQP